MTLSSTGFGAIARSNGLTKWVNRNNWVCGLCRRTIARQSISAKTRLFETDATSAPTSTPSQTTPKKPFYVTTPIFYVNAEPHVGHLFTLVLADIFKRWQVLLGKTDAKLLTGTDEHGMKVQQAAAAQDLTPAALCDQNVKTFQSLARDANVSYDHFIRTTDKAHANTVTHFWDMLEKRGYIYQSKHEGWYCVSEETFYPKSAVQAALDPATGRKIMTTIETGKEVEWSSETNYHFKLSALQDRLLEHYNQNPSFIVPKRHYESVVNEVKAGLSDLSISRPSSRISWGIPVPGDDTQTIYVWLDALVNYLTYAGYPWTPGHEHKSIWPADLHVVGKDIIRFHGIYWPAFLLALDLPLPRTILAHGHWTINREKMSKSIGNVVNPNFAIERFGVDAMRYFLAANGSLNNDPDYDNSYIVKRYKADLSRGLGNLTSRLLRGKLWNVRQSVECRAKGMLPARSELDEEHEKLLVSVRQQAKANMDNLNLWRTIDSIVSVLDKTEKYFHNSAPWRLAKEADPSTPNPANRVVYNTAESLRIVAILLQPVMPTKAGTLLDMLGVAQEIDKRNFDSANYGRDSDYGVPLVTLGKGIDGTLFPPLLAED